MINKWAVVDLDNSHNIFESAEDALAFMKSRGRKSYTVNIVTLPIVPNTITIHFVKVTA